jgi:hypothetical protein
MTQMVRVAVAADVTEAEEIESILRDAGIDTQLEKGEDDTIAVLVPDSSVESAKDAIESMTEPDELVSDA